MRLAIRHILLTYSLIVLLTTVFLIGITAYFTGRSSVEYLAQKNMGRQSEQLQEYTQQLLDNAARPSAALAERFQTPPTGDALEGLLPELHYLTHAYPELSYLSLGLEETGDYIHIHRFLNGDREESLYRHRPDGQTIQQDAPTREKADIALRPEGAPFLHPGEESRQARLDARLYVRLPARR
jgi:hypothetical protein